MVTILGLNAYHADAAACLVSDGTIVAAAEEERFRRVKHWAGLPTQAVGYCLSEAGMTLADVDHIAINRDPRANLLRKSVFTLLRRPNLRFVAARLKNAAAVNDPVDLLASELGEDAAPLNARRHAIEHHRAHLASAFFVSPFDQATVVSVDGFGDFASCMWARGRGATMERMGSIHFPHSLGLLYQAVTQYLGFRNYGDEYKVMGLAPYGKPSRLDELRRLVTLRPDGSYRLNLGFFRHHSDGVAMTWNDSEPVVESDLYSDRLKDLLGPARVPGEPITSHHQDIAASLQALYEEAFFHLLNTVQAKTGDTALCLAGGCAMNSVANGKIFANTGFRDLYVQAAAGDAGGAIGAAYSVHHDILGQPRGNAMTHAYLGPSWPQDALDEIISRRRQELDAEGCTRTRLDDEDALCRQTAAAIADGNVVGWFQGRMEWGPRALGNRSILCDPRRADMQSVLNDKIKRRESFRPFAPSILRECVADWFETDYDVPFMLQVFPVREERRAQIPAVTHVDGTGRLQTVTREGNPRYHKLIGAFCDLTGVPALLNTSFNENEPVVCRPEEAIDCFLRTNMDELVLGNTIVRRPTQGEA